MGGIIIFGGTTEGRELTEWLSSRGVGVDAFVATEYGARLIPEGAGIVTRVGRLDAEEMAELFRASSPVTVVDATHPYAAQVSENIRRAAAETGVELFRLRRAADWEPGQTADGLEPDVNDWVMIESAAEAAKYLAERTSGRILLTTGSKELAYFARPGLLERCVPRVLPSMDSLKQVLELGFEPKNVICMQGPFSLEMNTATLRQFDISVLLTKLTGQAGGFGEKAQAAQNCGVRLVVIERPEDSGLSYDEILTLFKERLGL